MKQKYVIKYKGRESYYIQSMYPIMICFSECYKDSLVIFDSLEEAQAEFEKWNLNTDTYEIVTW